MVLHVVQHLNMIVQLVSDLNAKLALSPNTGPESIQMLVLLLQHGLVVFVDLLVVEVALVRRALGLIAVREESGAVGCIVVDQGGGGDGAVVEADRLGRVGGVAGSFQEG